MEEKKNVATLEEVKEAIQKDLKENHEKRVKAFLEKGVLSLRNFSGTKKYRSIKRAIKRGHISLYGDVYPKRPFSNRKRGEGTATHARKEVAKQLKSLEQSND